MRSIGGHGKKAAVYLTNTGEQPDRQQEDDPSTTPCSKRKQALLRGPGAPGGRGQATMQREAGPASSGKPSTETVVACYPPAIIKLNWRDYFSARGDGGTVCVIGEDLMSYASSTGTARSCGSRCTERKMLDAFSRYDRGYGQIVLQCNVEGDTRPCRYAITVRRRG